MKKWLFLFVVTVFIISVYLFIPKKLIISGVTTANGNVDAASRCFLDTSKWSKWWPRGYSYQIRGIQYNTAQVFIQCKDDCNINSTIRIVAVNQDSMFIGWECSLETGADPFTKISRRLQVQPIKKNMAVITDAFKSFIGESKNIYGVNFHHTISKDSTLVYMSPITSTYPTTREIYQLVDTIKKYIVSQSAQEINYPMLNISKINDSQYRTIVAISVNKELKGKGRIVIRHFVPWKMIEGEVHGGRYTIEKAFEELYHYKNDHQNSIMALPFQSLITDRSREPDTSKWITNICVPIS